MNSQTYLLTLNSFHDFLNKSKDANKTSSVQSTIAKFSKKNVKEYVDTIDGSAITNTCKECEVDFTTEHGLEDHYRSKHEGVTYSCNNKTRPNPRKYKHKGVNYPCDKCDHHALTQSRLKELSKR